MPKKVSEKKEKKASTKKPAAQKSKKSGSTTSKRYFESESVSGGKFWEVWQDGCTVFTRYGKVGTAGSTTEKEFDSDDKAEKEAAKLIRQKTGKGYVEAGGGSTVKKASKKSSAKKSSKKPAKKRKADSEDEDGAEEDEEEEEKPKKKKAKTSKKAAEKKEKKNSTKGSKKASKKAPASKDEASGKRYFESDSKSGGKFWEVWQEGEIVYTRHGKIGAAGGTSVKDLGSDEKAEKEVAKLIRQKTSKGYSEPN